MSVISTIFQTISAPPKMIIERCVDVPQFFESNTDLNTVGRLCRVESNVRLLGRHDFEFVVK